jgi:hypothetical protein
VVVQVFTVTGIGDRDDFRSGAVGDAGGGARTGGGARRGVGGRDKWWWESLRDDS